MDEGMDGEERRGEDRDHDVLTRIDANLSNFMRRFDDHAGNDEKQFEKIDARTGRLEKFMWILMGAFFLFEVGIKFFGK